HAEQNRLADSGTREDAEALTFAARHEGVQSAHAEIELAADAGARVRGGRSGAQNVRLHALWKGALAVKGTSKGVDDAAKPSAAWMNSVDAVLEGRARTECDAIELPKGHGQRTSVTEANDFAGRFIARAAGNTQPAAQADGTAGASHFDEEPFHAGDPSEAG